LADLAKNAALDGDQPDTLAKRLSQGPLPLGYALQYATDVANNLRILHEEGRLHGSVSANSVIVTSAGAQLLPPNGHARYTVPGADISAFGALLHEMLTGSKPSPRSTPPLPSITSRNTEKGIEIAATRLASKCLRSTSNSSSEMQKVLTEVRLLCLQAKIRVRPAPAPPPAAPVTAAPQPERAPVVAEKPRPPRLFTAIPADGFIDANFINTWDSMPTGLKCPLCGVPYVYPSRPRTWVEIVLVEWGSDLLRCHRCLHRYVKFLGRFTFSKGSPVKANQRGL